MQDIEMKTVQANGLHFRVAVAGSGTPVVLLHGFPDTHSVWHKQIGPLVAAGYQVIAPDQRGCGDTEMAAAVSAYSLDLLASDLVVVLDALGIHQPVHLVGHDWGAAVGWKLACDHASRFLSYAAMSVGHPNEYRGSIEQKLRAWYVFVFLIPGLAERLLSAGDWAVLRRMSPDPAETETRIAALSRPGRLTAGLNWYRANARQLLTKRFPTTPLPVFGLWSDGDFALAEGQMRDSRRQVTGPWRYARIDRASHWLQLDQPDEVNSLLLAWLAQQV